MVVNPGDLQVGTHVAASMAQRQYFWVARISLEFLRAGILFFRNCCEYSRDESSRAKGGAWSSLQHCLALLCSSTCFHGG